MTTTPATVAQNLLDAASVFDLLESATVSDLFPGLKLPVTIRETGADDPTITVDPSAILHPAIAVIHLTVQVCAQRLNMDPDALIFDVRSLLAD